MLLFALSWASGSALPLGRATGEGLAVLAMPPAPARPAIRMGENIPASMPCPPLPRRARLTKSSGVIVGGLETGPAMSAASLLSSLGERIGSIGERSGVVGSMPEWKLATSRSMVLAFLTFFLGRSFSGRAEKSVFSAHSSAVPLGSFPSACMAKNRRC